MAMAELCSHKSSAIPWPSSQDHPLGQGTLYSVPARRSSDLPFDVSRCLEGQTTSESYETRTVASVSKRASQRSKNYIHTTSVLREKTRKPKDTRRKGETTAHDRPPSPPAGELGYGGWPWPSSAVTRARPSHGRAPRITPWGRGLSTLSLLDALPIYPSTFRGVWRVKRPRNLTKQGPLRPYRRELRNGPRITFIRLRCFEKRPENQRIRAEKAKRRRMTDPRAPQPGSSAMGDGHGRALQSQELGHPMAELPGSPPGAGDSLLCPCSTLFRSTLRRFEVFGGSNDLGILRNKDRCVRIEESFATVQELHSYDFGASRKDPKTKGYAPKRRNDGA